MNRVVLVTMSFVGIWLLAACAPPKPLTPEEIAKIQEDVKKEYAAKITHATIPELLSSAKVMEKNIDKNLTIKVEPVNMFDVSWAETLKYTYHFTPHLVNGMDEYDVDTSYTPQVIKENHALKITITNGCNQIYRPQGSEITLKVNGNDVAKGMTVKAMQAQDAAYGTIIDMTVMPGSKQEVIKSFIPNSALSSSPSGTVTVGIYGLPKCEGSSGTKHLQWVFNYTNANIQVLPRSNTAAKSYFRPNQVRVIPTVKNKSGKTETYVYTGASTREYVTVSQGVIY